MKRVCWTALPVLLAFASASNAQSVRYKDALKAAAHDQPQVRASELRLDARRDVADAADELPDPKLRVGLRNLPVTGPDPLDPTMMTVLEVGVDQQIPNPAERRARAGLAVADIARASAELSYARNIARLGAGRAWISLAYAQRAEDVANDALHEIERLVPLARSSVAAGTARPGESLEVRRAVLKVEDRRTQIRADMQTAQARLARYIAVAEALAVGPPPSPEVNPEQLRASLEYTPEILLAETEIRQAEAGVDLARSDLRPDFSVGASYGVRERRYGDLFSVMGTVTLPLFAKRRQQPRIEAARAQAAAASEARLDMLRTLEAQFGADLAAWRSAYRQWRRASDELLPLAVSRAGLERASFAAGRADLLDVIDAIKTLALLRIEILAREQATVEAAANLRLTYREHGQ
tara:strand:- start:1470 stop:2699 length:1230 start_codon:yes stop_codon:yes gene_type:complete